jgi:Tfp pilus assembly protein PilO
MGRFIIPILLLAAAAAAFVGLTSPIYADLQGLQEEESAYNNALSNSARLREVGGALRAKFNQFSPADKGRLEKMLPDALDNIKLAIEIQNIAGNTSDSLSVESVQYDPNAQGTIDPVTGQQQQANTLYEEFELEIIAEGTYTQFIDFLEKLERSLRIVDVVNVDFSSESSFAGAQTYTYNITIKTYRLRN